MVNDKELNKRIGRFTRLRKARIARRYNPDALVPRYQRAWWKVRSWFITPPDRRSLRPAPRQKKPAKENGGQVQSKTKAPPETLTGATNRLGEALRDLRREITRAGPARWYR